MLAIMQHLLFVLQAELDVLLHSFLFILFYVFIYFLMTSLHDLLALQNH